ncbi:MAG: tRNA pseudouridine(38-40) synthase TruA [Lachnospiraceae bacterium]|jgi:tRNA pseudouridine38-40 synthase|nr:tRNA pseudouridine(38-40) synthase TruA [Lachnospiraceae bacterium]
MPRILLKIAYDGTDFAGFQRQPGQRTVEGELDRALTELTGEPVLVIGASRTDAGVHAQCNFAVFDTASRIPPEKFGLALNGRLPEQIRVTRSFEVPPEFHPRRCATEKTYEYHIWSAAYPDPMKRLYSFHTCFDLDTDRMGEAAQYLVGEHDFASFCCVYTQAETTVRTVTSVAVEASGLRQPREIVIRVTGTGFLYNMVRIIAGTLIEVGRGARQPGEVRQMLEAKDRRAAGPTAPAKGLVLVQYRFLDEKLFDMLNHGVL